MFAVDAPIDTRVILRSGAGIRIIQLCQFDVRRAIEATSDLSTAEISIERKIGIARCGSRRKWRTQIQTSSHHGTIGGCAVHVATRRRQDGGHAWRRSGRGENFRGNAVGIGGGYLLDKTRSFNVVDAESLVERVLSFVGKKEKYLTFVNRAANASAEIAKLVFHTHVRGSLEISLEPTECIECIQTRLAVPKEGAAMKGVGAGLRNHLDLRARIPSIFSGITARRDLKFSDRFLCRGYD